MEFDGKDSNADKVKLYESVRQKMAKIYDHELPKFINCSVILNIISARHLGPLFTLRILRIFFYCVDK